MARHLDLAAAATDAGRPAAVAQALAAMAFGFFILGMVGFSHIDALHNAAHDVRHSNAFPCH